MFYFLNNTEIFIYLLEQHLCINYIQVWRIAYGIEENNFNK